MALSLSAVFTRTYTYFCLAIAIFIVSSGASVAENLPDPTRPPPVINRPIDSSGVPVPFQVGPVLQAVIFSPGKSRATISGKDVKVGDKIEGGKVIAIRESEVLLRIGKEDKVLRLFPPMDNRSGSTKSTDNRLDPKSDRLTK